jgi:hypothetical protein
MSWNISIHDLPQNIQNIADLPDDYQPSPLGLRQDVIARIQAILPDVDFSDPTWGMFDRPDFAIEFNMGSKEICDSFMLRVTGGGDAVYTIAALLQQLQLRGVDCQTGDLFAIEATQHSFEQWQEYRDTIYSGTLGMATFTGTRNSL